MAMRIILVVNGKYLNVTILHVLKIMDLTIRRKQYQLFCVSRDMYLKEMQVSGNRVELGGTHEHGYGSTTGPPGVPPRGRGWIY